MNTKLANEIKRRASKAGIDPNKVVVATVSTPAPAAPTADAGTPPSQQEAPAAEPPKPQIPRMTAKERAEWHKRMTERCERECQAIRVIKHLAPEQWKNQWVLHNLDWLEAKATEVREAADLKKQQPKAAKAA